MKTHIIPKHKFDFEATENLKQFTIDQIRVEIPFILEWMQDGNWPVASPVSEYFKPHINKIENELMDILMTNDIMWKYWILRLIWSVEVHPGTPIMNEIRRIAQYPTPDEIDSDIHETATEIMEILK